MSGRPPRGAGIVLGAILGPLVALAVAHNGDTCRPVDVTTAPPSAVDLARSHGWTADPTDGMEALHPPGCRTP